MQLHNTVLCIPLLKQVQSRSWENIEALLFSNQYVFISPKG
jgi:hypothetical protein